MAQRGRKSAAALALVSVNVEAIPRQKAPAELSKEEAEVWDSIVAAEPADWFSGSTRPILAQYCRHIIAARRVAEMVGTLEAEIATKSAEQSERLAVMLPRQRRSIVC